MAQPLFRPYTGGIQPIQGQIEAGARIGQMYQQGLSSLGAGLAEGIKEYYKNSALNDQAAAEAESAAGNLTRMMAMLGQSPEYAPFVSQYTGLLDKAKKAPTMSLPQRLSLANELKVATQNLGTDMQMYNIGVQSRARSIAYEQARALEGATVDAETREVKLGIVLDSSKNTTSQLNAYREKYNKLNEATGGKAGTWFQFLKKQQGGIEASIDAIPDEYFRQYDPNVDPKIARERMKADVKDYIGNEEKVYVQSREAFKDATAGSLMSGLARAGVQAGALLFGNKEQAQGASSYFSGLGKRVGEISAMAQEADKRAMEMGEAASPLEASAKKNAEKSNEEKKRASELEAARIESAKASLGKLEFLAKKTAEEIETIKSTPIETRVKIITNGTGDMYGMGSAYFEGTRTDAEILRESQQREAKIKEKEKKLDELNKQIADAKAGALPKQPAATPAQPRLVPSFGVASAVIGKETIKVQMGTAQKKQIVADYVKKQMGFDSATIDSVVANMFPSDGPNVRTVQTAQGMATFVQNEKGGWNQVTGFATGEKSWGMFGTMTTDGKVAPKTIQSANGAVQVRLAGQFQGPDSAFVKFNDGLVSYLDGMEAAKRLQEIAKLGAGAAFDRAMAAEAEGLVARIKAAVRTEIVGTGSISDYEQKLLDSIIYNPATFWSLSSANQARILGVMDKMNSHLVNQGRVWGVNISTNLQSNSERETQLRMGTTGQ